MQNVLKKIDFRKIAHVLSSYRMKKRVWATFTFVQLKSWSIIVTTSLFNGNCVSAALGQKSHFIISFIPIAYLTSSHEQNVIKFVELQKKRTSLQNSIKILIYSPFPIDITNWKAHYQQQLKNGYILILRNKNIANVIILPTVRLVNVGQMKSGLFDYDLTHIVRQCFTTIRLCMIVSFNKSNTQKNFQSVIFPHYLWNVKKRTTR